MGSNSQPAISLTEPSEITQEEFQDLIAQIRSEFSVAECQAELLDAARYNDIDVVRALLNCHPDLHTYQDVTNGNTALHMAAANGHASVVALLLQVGADATIANQAGNTPLHWAAANGQEAVVQVLLNNAKQQIDVLQRNSFGRSALTEGFSSENTELVKSLLEHESASEERLISTATTTTNGPEDDAESEENYSVTHSFVLGQFEEDGDTSMVAAPVRLQIRELPIAKSDQDSILGQQSPDADTTGLGIWAASLVCAQWMVSLVQQSASSSSPSPNRSPLLAGARTVLELGAGCGMPGLSLVAASLAGAAATTTIQKVYLTDFNPKTVDNLQFNVQLNGFGNNSSAAASTMEKTNGPNMAVEVLNMNWQDPSTWPQEKVDVIIGSDLIYQSDMVPLLVQTVKGLLAEQGHFLYVAPETGRQGQEELFAMLKQEKMEMVWESTAPEAYSRNPLESQDDDDFFLHFNELQSMECGFKLYDFHRRCPLR